MAFKNSLVLPLGLIVGFSLNTALADNLSLGLTGGWSSTLYNEVDQNKNNMVFPNIDYDAGRSGFMV